MCRLTPLLLILLLSVLGCADGGASGSQPDLKVGELRDRRSEVVAYETGTLRAREQEAVAALMSMLPNDRERELVRKVLAPNSPYVIATYDGDPRIADQIALVYALRSVRRERELQQRMRGQCADHLVFDDERCGDGERPAEPGN